MTLFVIMAAVGGHYPEEAEATPDVQEAEKFECFSHGPGGTETAQRCDHWQCTREMRRIPK
jgi:hypothetical protein